MNKMTQTTKMVKKDQKQTAQMKLKTKHQIKYNLKKVESLQAKINDNLA